MNHVFLYQNSVSFAFYMSSVLNTKPALEADLPVDMLLEIAYWCDYPELCNLMLALNNDKLIKNNELFWNKYFQRITS